MHLKPIRVADAFLKKYAARLRRIPNIWVSGTCAIGTSDAPDLTPNVLGHPDEHLFEIEGIRDGKPEITKQNLPLEITPPLVTKCIFHARPLPSAHAR